MTTPSASSRRDEPAAATPALRFGRAILPAWPLDPAISYLNHGTVGVTPRRVLAAQDAIRDEIETNPSRHLLREVTPMLGGEERRGRLRTAAERVARFLGARGDDLAFVDNDSTGVSAVLASQRLGPGDEVLVTTTTYGGVAQAVRHACRRSGAATVVVEDPSPLAGPEAVLDAVERAITPRTRLAVLDHIVSETGVVLPIAELVALCRRRGSSGLRVLVDGAHVPGQLPLALPSIGADWYAANLHKWAFAPRSCGVLWASPEAQPDLHPTVVSWNLDRGFTDEFDWTGTRDPSAFLAAPAGIAFLEELGFERARAYCHEVLWQGVELLGERWRRLGAAEREPRAIAPESMSGSMTAVPLPAALGGDRAAAERVRDALLFAHGVEVAVFALRGRLWTRVSVQVYNEASDFERLAAAVLALSGAA